MPLLLFEHGGSQWCLHRLLLRLHGPDGMTPDGLLGLTLFDLGFRRVRLG
ncbi:hypothetical protein [Deinococcus arcticus]|nr:hypothetical protein [Deinococcus arcticus]